MLHNVKVLVLAVLGLILFSGFTAHAEEMPTQKIGMLYSHKYLVTDVNRLRDEVMIEDLTDGNEFVFSGCEDWMVNDYASVLMSDSGTPVDRTDDIIICATCLNTLAAHGKISYRQEHMMLRPGSERNPYALDMD